MRQTHAAAIALAAIALLTPPGHAAGYSPEYSRILREAAQRRRQEVRRHNHAQAEAARLLFGPRGLPALARPADPWPRSPPTVRVHPHRYPVRRRR